MQSELQEVQQENTDLWDAFKQGEKEKNVSLITAAHDWMCMKYFS